MHKKIKSAIVYGDVSLNIIDGSSIWLASISQTLTNIFDEVHVLLKAPIDNERLLAPLRSNPKITIHAHTNDPKADPLPARKAAQRLASLVAEIDPNTVIVRGTDVCIFASGNTNIAKRLWAYVTDLPFPPTKISERSLDRLKTIASRSFRMFAQTEAARSYLESLCPEAAGKTVLLNPMVPDVFFDYSSLAQKTNQKLRLVYSGKFANEWRTLEMLSLPGELQKLGISSQLIMVGDKFQKDTADRLWHVKMKTALEKADADPMSGVIWAGGLPREEALKVVSQAHLGLSWRSPSMDASLELSTKLLEYSAVGTAVIANRCLQHEEIFGDDYPLLIETDSAETVANIIAGFSPDELAKIGLKNNEKVLKYSENQSANRLKLAFTRAGSLTTKPEINSKKILVASHDFKFMGEIIDHIKSSPLYQLEIDHWKTLHENDEEKSLALVNDADIILCEWCGPNALWYSRNKKPGQTLVVRLHRFEMNGPWMNDIDFSKIDKLVFVSEIQRRETLLKFDSIKEEQTLVINNVIDTSDLDRPKAKESNFHIGLMGFVPFLKRPDRALDLLEELLKHDDRYVLHFRGRMPWEYPYEWNNPIQQQLYLEFFKRIKTSNILRSHVVFDSFGPDIANWFRKIGVVLSPSDHESFHLATAEGMASGAIPIVWDRPGSQDIFGADNIHIDLETTVERILSLREPKNLSMSSIQSKTYVKKWDSFHTMKTWDNILTNHNE